MLINGDCLEELKKLPDNSVDELVTDPPYGISFMGKSWDDFSKGQEKINKLKENGYTSGNLAINLERNHPIYNFKGMIEFYVPIWKECLRVLKPGAFGFIMCIPRQDCLSRMMISLEDAGFNTNFTSLYWTYASGFPKALNVGKAIDKRAGAKREVVGKKPNICGYKDYEKHIQDGKNNPHQGENKLTYEKWCEITAPATPDAKRLEGSYGGFQPKPAVEVIIVVMKPLSEKGYVDQALDNGKGVTWFDDCRIPYKDISESELKRCDQVQHAKSSIDIGGAKPGDVQKLFNVDGRFPANLLVSDDVLDDGKDHVSQGGNGFINKESTLGSNGKIYNCPGDSGSFSRYFSLDAWAEKNLPFLIVSKASKREKNEGCEKLKEKERHTDHLYGQYAICGDCKKLLNSKIDHSKCNGKVEYISSTNITKNNHPTVKPIKLMSYLITLGSRPGDVILDPFSGSGTTGVSAVMLNRDYICIEKDPEYFKILKARIEAAHKRTLNEI